jgi:hypothetical protein
MKTSIFDEPGPEVRCDLAGDFGIEGLLEFDLVSLQLYAGSV